MKFLSPKDSEIIKYSLTKEIYVDQFVRMYNTTVVLFYIFSIILFFMFMFAFLLIKQKYIK